jgi:hypothetical protein
MLNQNTTMRFWAKVSKGPGCWLWTAATRHGYGAFGVPLGNARQRVAQAHRVAYELAKGKIPDGAVIMHTCDTPLCVNPDHLRCGSMSDNSTDAVMKGRWHSVRSPRRFRRANARRPHVRRLLELLGSQSAVAEVLGVSRQRVFSLLKEENIG